MHRTLIIFIATMLLLVATSCAGKGENAVTTAMPTTDSETLTTATKQVLGVWSAEINPDTKTFTVTPDIREASFHLPLTQYYPNVLKITGYGWTPNFWADIQLTHPFSTGQCKVDGFDTRIIAIIPAKSGVSFTYPIFDCVGNNKAIINPDGYTKLFDNFGGSIPGNTNPFKAYFKDQRYRVWSNAGVMVETQRWDMNFEGFGGPLRFKLVVDVSTDYPNPSQPVIDNAPEPVKIDATIGQGLSQNGGSADVTVTLLDWQGQDTIGGVCVEAPNLFNGVVNLAYSTLGPNPNEYVYAGTITNEKLAPEGEYKTLITAWDQATSIHIYNEFTVLVNQDITGQGNLMWARSATSERLVDGRAITTLSDDSTVVTGHFENIGAIFGKGEPNQTILDGDGGYDIFIARYNPDGTLAWAKRAGGVNNDIGWGITALSDDSTVVTGFYGGDSATFGYGEPNQTILNCTGYPDIFVAKYNPDGTLAWARRVGGSASYFDYGYGITALSDDSTVLTGKLGEDIFVAQYDPNGTLMWIKNIGGPLEDSGQGITTLSSDSVIVTGYFQSSVTFGPGEPNQTILNCAGYSDVFIARFNSDGTLVWAKRAGGSFADAGSDITVLSDNSAVVSGDFNQLATFGPGEINETVLTSAGSWDIFITRYNLDGTLAWAKRAGGLSQDVSQGITTLSGNSTVITGWFNDSIVFGDGEPNQTILTSTGREEIFIARYNPEGILAWAKRAGGTDRDFSEDVTTLSDDSTVATGFFFGSAVFGPGEPNETVLTSGGFEDCFIARFEP